MAITSYATDEDLLKIRPDILDLGVSDWDDQHKRAFQKINRDIEVRWYRPTCADLGIDWRVTEFDPDELQSGQLNTLACYKALELVYMFLMKNTENPDGFERQMKLFSSEYEKELQSIISFGLSYDWDDSGAVEDDEEHLYQPRRLYRG
jgi:hypothetical protein